MKIIRVSLCVAYCLLVGGVAGSLTGCAGDRYQRTTGEYVDDTIVSSRVAAALAANPEFKFDDVIVAAHQGVVQLSGFVPRDDQKGRAEEIAEKVTGVKDVENNITVRP